MERINKIIEKRKHGIECTEDEITEIKNWLASLKLSEEQFSAIYCIIEYFTIEYGEAVEEGLF